MFVRTSILSVSSNVSGKNKGADLIKKGDADKREQLV